MVVYDAISFPASSSPTILLGTANVPYGSTDGVNRQIIVNTPVGISFSVGALVSPNAQTITATISAITSVAVYKNGVSLTTQSVSPSFSSIAKSYTLGSATGAISFNSYMQQLTFTYVPTTLPTFNNTDVYTFYATFSYTLSSTKSGAASLLTSTGAGSINYGIIANTTTSTSSFNQMSYASGSSNSSGYVAYSLTTPLVTGNNFSVSNLGYVPAISNTLWTGINQLASIYSRTGYFIENIFLKNIGSAPTLTWLNTDANGAGIIAQIYASITSNALIFDSKSALSNGFKFLSNGTEVASISSTGVLTCTGFTQTRPKTWFIYSTYTTGNGATQAGRNLGSGYIIGGGTGYWDTKATYGGASASAYTLGEGYFTADADGLYSFQLSMFNNSCGTSGRWLQAAGTCVPIGNQYLMFNQSYLSSADGMLSVHVMYYMTSGQTFYFVCPNQSPSFYYASGHTTLQIIKLS
jgi:hypothetical protein